MTIRGCAVYNCRLHFLWFNLFLNGVSFHSLKYHLLVLIFVSFINSNTAAIPLLL